MSEAERIWASACQILQTEMSRVSYETWVDSSLKPHSLVNDHLLVKCVNQLIMDIGVKRFLPNITEAVCKAAGKTLTVEVLCTDELEGRMQELDQQQAGPRLANLNPKYTFDTFVVGGGNRFAHAVSLAVAEVPSQAYNPLFIYGGVGLGKTHLMHAIGHYAHELHPEMNIVYITSEDFTNQLVTAMQTNRNQQFRDRFRNADILMVDDIQFIAGKSATEEEFFHTFNHLKEAGKQIIMTSDKPPREIQKLEERLCSRFEGGLNADIQRPDFETRLAILRKKAEFEHLIISDDVLVLIAERIDTNVRELEGSLTRLTAYSGLTRRPVDMQLAQEALKELLKRDTRPISTELIQESVAAYYGITVDDLKSPRRNHDITVPRQIAMYLIRSITNLSLMDIGREYENRNHSTVLQSIRKVEELLRTDPEMADAVRDITSNINSRG